MKSKEKIVVVMGATGSGKSSLSVDLALRFTAEIINSDKMQFYDGLKVTTNQSTMAERRGVPHHLLGELDPEDGEVTAKEFRNMAAQTISGITYRKKLQILAGGSNSYIHALLAKSYDQGNYPFSPDGSICSELRYDCCFIWIDVDQTVLFEYLYLRLDKMMKTSMFEEIAEFHRSKKAPERAIGDQPVIRNLAKEKMGNLTKKAKEVLEDLCSAQEESLSNPTSQAENIALRRWENVSMLEEKYLKQKSKLHGRKWGIEITNTFTREWRREEHKIQYVKSNVGMAA